MNKFFSTVSYLARAIKSGLGSFFLFTPFSNSDDPDVQFSRLKNRYWYMSHLARARAIRSGLESFFLFTPFTPFSNCDRLDVHFVWNFRHFHSLL